MFFVRCRFIQGVERDDLLAVVVVLDGDAMRVVVAASVRSSVAAFFGGSASAWADQRRHGRRFWNGRYYDLSIFLAGGRVRVDFWDEARVRHRWMRIWAAHLIFIRAERLGFAHGNELVGLRIFRVLKNGALVEMPIAHPPSCDVFANCKALRLLFDRDHERVLAGAAVVLDEIDDLDLLLLGLLRLLLLWSVRLSPDVEPVVGFAQVEHLGVCGRRRHRWIYKHRWSVSLFSLSSAALLDFPSIRIQARSMSSVMGIAENDEIELWSDADPGAVGSDIFGFEGIPVS